MKDLVQDLVLIKAPNKRPIEERDETLHSKITQGEYDNELEWLVYQSLIYLLG